MPSNRHTRDAVLDAARACVLAVGVRRTTLTDVARLAGMSRMTVYRNFPDVDTLVRDLMTREFERIIETSRASRDGASHARGRLVAEAVSCVRALHASDVLQRVVDVDPELLIPYVVDRIGSTQRTAVALLSDGICRGQADGSVRSGAHDALAYGMLLAVQSFVLSARPIAGAVPRERMYDELSHLLDAYLAPRPCPGPQL